MVTSVVGIIVAVVSGVFGISAHGLAAGAAGAAGAGGIGATALPPTSGDLLMVGAASAGIGAVTAALARRRPPVLTAAAGLLAGQGLVHLVLSSGHSHAHAGGMNAGGGSAAGALGHHATDPAAVRAAMDASATGMGGAAGIGGIGGIGGAGAGGGHLSSLLTPEMLGAHVAAVAVTLGLVAILSRTLSWVAARVSPLLGRVRVVVVVPLLASYDALAPRARYLLAGGGTRAPPALV